MFKRIVSGIMLTALFIGILTLAFNIHPVKADPKTWTVDDDGPADFHTIQEAIDAASHGDTIFVYNGTYYEHVAVNKSVQLIGQNRSNTVVDGSGIGTVFNVTSDDVVVKGFTIRNVGPYSGERCVVVVSSNVTIMENELYGGNRGIALEYSDSNTISNNKLFDQRFGIDVDCDLSGTDNLISNNLIDGTSHYGIYLQHARSYGGIINNNTVTNCNNAIYVGNSYGSGALSVNISENKVLNNSGYGLSLYSVHSGAVVGNFIANGKIGIAVKYCIDLTFRRNIMINNSYNFGFFSGERRVYYLHDIDTSNTIDGKSVYYLRNQQNLVIDPSVLPEIGFLGIVDSINITVRDIGISENIDGLLLVSVRNSTVENFNVSDSWYAIHLVDVTNITIRNCSITSHIQIWHGATCGIYATKGCSEVSIIGNHISSYKNGIYLDDVRDDFLIEMNNITENGIGIHAYESWNTANNTITKNNISYNNGNGILISHYEKGSCLVYLNNFLNNTCQAFVAHSPSPSSWDNSVEGNFWSDYEGIDANGDGIGDTPYFIDENNVDRYPFMKESGWEIPTPELAIHDLIDIVESMNLQQGIDNSLDAKLTAVLHALEALNADQRNDAVNKLNAFINEVEAQREKKLTNEQADYLIAATQEIIDVID